MKKKLALLLSCFFLVTLLLSACGYNSHDLDVAYDAGYEKGYKTGSWESIDDAFRSARNAADTKSLDFEEAIYIADCFLNNLPEKEDLTDEDYRNAMECLFRFADYFFEEYYA